MKTLALICLFFILGGLLGANSIEPQVVEVTRIVKVEVPIYTERVIEYRPLATKEELDRVYQIIDEGEFAHRYYADHPDLQSPQTGDTEFNIQWLNNYRLIRELFGRAYGGSR